ncbi:hypothetical protein N0V88_003241 [Collariella sp. IMI 366227]|nr:hypothetical protein N0V88_003241 [Collariella sp. IMI 366227]
MANKTQEYGDLLVTMTSAFDWRWNDRGSGADRDGGFWHPKPQGGIRPMGSVVVGHHGDLPNQWAVLLVSDNPSKRPAGKGPAVQAPTDYQPLWTDQGSGSKADGSFWRPVAPPGYITLGDVANAGYNKPSFDQVWCLRADLVADGIYKPGPIWDDKGSGAKADASFWDIIPHARNSASDPQTLLPSPPSITKDTLPDIGDTFSSTVHSTVTLPFTSFFDPSDRASLDTLPSLPPFCTITKRVAWIVLSKFPNYQSTPYTQTQTITTGVRRSQSSTTAHSTGVTVTSEAGYGLAKWSVSLNYQFSFSQSSAVEEMEERKVEKTITVAPHTVAIAWGKRVVVEGRGQMGRGWRGRAFEASEEIAVGKWM